jgi:hypothetical protein
MLLEVCSCSIDIHIFDEILDLLWIGLTWYGYFTRIEAIWKEHSDTALEKPLVWTQLVQKDMQINFSWDSHYEYLQQSVVAQVKVAAQS